MKQFFSKQLTNIVFLVLIVAAALAIYLLSRAETASASATVGAGLESPSPSPVATDEPTPRGIPEAVWTTHLLTSEFYLAEETRADARTLTLTSGEKSKTSALLLYTVLDGCVNSLEFTFIVPSSYDSDSKSLIEQRLHAESKKQLSSMQDSVRTILADLLPVSDAENRLEAATARYWAEQALLLKKAGDDFEDTVEGCRFLAYRVARNEKELLVCCLFFE